MWGCSSWSGHRLVQRSACGWARSVGKVRHPLTTSLRAGAFLWSGQGALRSTVLDREVDRAMGTPRKLMNERQRQALLFANYAKMTRA